MSKLKEIGLVIAKEIFNFLIFVSKLVFFLTIAMPIIFIWLYVILTFDGTQVNEISLSQLVANRNIQYFSFLIAVGFYVIYRLCNFKHRPSKTTNTSVFGSYLNKLN